MPASYDQIFYTWSDRKFHQLSMDQRQRTMSEMDPEFAALDPKKQQSLLLQAYQKYYVDKQPPPDASAVALSLSGIDPSEIDHHAPTPEVQMEEQSGGTAGGLLRSVEGLSLPGLQAPVPVQPQPGVPGARRLARAVPPQLPAPRPPVQQTAPAPGRYGDVQILEEEPPALPPSKAPIFAARSGRVATTPTGQVVPLPNPYDRTQPGIRTAPVPVNPVTGIEKDDPWVGEDVNPVSRAINTAALGTVQGATSTTLGAAGGLTQALGDATGIDTLSNVGRDLSTVSNGISEAIPPAVALDPRENPEVLANPDWWAYQVGQGLGSMLPMMLMGMGAGAAIERAPKAIADRLAAWGPSLAGGVTEGLQAGGLAYDEAIREGLSQEEARKRMFLIAAGTAASSMPALKYGVFAEHARSGKSRAILGAVGEAVQEGPVQQTIENVVKGRPLSEGQIESIVGGGLGGGIVGGVLGHQAGAEDAPPPPVLSPRFQYLDESEYNDDNNNNPPPPPGAPPVPVEQSAPIAPAPPPEPTTPFAPSIEEPEQVVEPPASAAEPQPEAAPVGSQQEEAPRPAIPVITAKTRQGKEEWRRDFGLSFAATQDPNLSDGDFHGAFSALLRSAGELGVKGLPVGATGREEAVQLAKRYADAVASLPVKKGKVVGAKARQSSAPTTTPEPEKPFREAEYRRRLETPGMGSFEGASITAEAKRLSALVDTLEKNHWTDLRDLHKKAKGNGRRKDGQRDVNDLLAQLKEWGEVQLAWNPEGHTFYAVKGAAPIKGLVNEAGEPILKPKSKVPGARKPKKTVNIEQEQPSGETRPAESPVRTGAIGQGPAVHADGGSAHPTVGGAETTVRVPGEARTYKAKYAVREADDIVASHLGVTFQKNPRYAFINDRNYSDPVNQERVVINSSREMFDPAYHITDNPDATNGPSIIDADGNVLGGNNRRMILERVFDDPSHPGVKAYRDMLMQKAQQFGIDPKQIAGMRNPVLVRELSDADLDAQRAITDFNKKGTAELTAAERATAEARALTEGTVDWLGGLVENAGPTATLNDVLLGRTGVEVVNRLVDEGVFTMQEKPNLIDTRTSALTSAAKERISKMLLGRLFRDSDQMMRTPPETRNKLERLVAPLMRVQSNPEWNLLPAFREAMDLLEYARSHGIQNLSDATNQQDMFGSAPEFSEVSLALAEAIRDKTPTALAAAVKKYASDSVPTMFGQVSPEDAFSDAFGKSLLEKISAAGEAATARLREKGITTGLSLGAHNFADPEVVRDFAVSIAGDVARGAITFRQWSRNMVEVYGKSVRPALKKIWEQAETTVAPQGYKAWKPGMPLEDVTRSMVPKTVQKQKKLEDVTRYLDIQTRNALGTIPASATDAQKTARLNELGRQEMADQMKKPDSGANWYAEDTLLADEYLAEIFPELRSNPALNIFQKAISAVMSNNSKPNAEAYNGARIYEIFRRDFKTLPQLQPNGKNWPAQGANKQIPKLQRMIDELGIEGTVEFLTSEKTVREIKKYRSGAKGKLDSITNGSMVLGPKIGRYFLDLMGVEHEGSTVDKWDARGQYRRLGRLTRPDGKIAEVPVEAERPLFMKLHADLAKENNLSRASAAQSVIWHYEQDLYRRLGLNVQSTARSTGVGRFLRERGVATPQRTATDGNAPAQRESAGTVEGRESNNRGTDETSRRPNGPVSGKREVSARRRATQRGSISFRKQQPPPQSKKYTFIHSDVEEAVGKARETPSREDEFSAGRKRWQDFKNSLTRTYQHLPREKYHRLIFKLKQLEKAPGIASQISQENIENITADLDVNQFEAFSNKILLDDMKETYDAWAAAGELPEGADDFFQLAFKLNPNRLRQELPRLTAFVNADPKIKAALRKREQIMNQIRDEYFEAMEAAGHPVEDRLSRKKYFRHRVLQAIRDNQTESAMLGGGPKVPGGRSFLKKRGANAAFLDYSTDYITAEYEVMAQLLADTRKARMIAWLESSEFNMLPELQKKAAAITARRRQTDPDAEAEDWRDHIPDTHKEWHPDSKNVFFLAHSLPERIAEQVLKNVGTEIGITDKDLRKVMALGGKRNGIVLPKEVVETFDNLRARPYDPAERAANDAVSAWKQYVLLAPWRFPKSQLRNLTGDLENTLGGNHKALRHLKRVYKDLKEYYDSAKAGKPEMSPELREWFMRGGFQSTEVVNELGDLQDIDHLGRLLKTKSPQVPGARRVALMPLKATKAVFNQMKMYANQREAVLRYANYLEYLDQIRANGRPDSYGRSIREEVDALDSAEDKAYKLSNDLLGAYDEVSAAGQKWRRRGMPFWSFQELNMRGYLQFWRNAARDPVVAGQVGRHILGPLGARSKYLAVRLGSQTLKLGILWAALHAWNKVLWPEEEKSLREEIRNRPHIILGRHADGSVRYFARLGNIPDLLEWFDPFDAIDQVQKVLNNQIGPIEAAKRFVIGGPVEKLLLGMNPGNKMVWEMISSTAAFPSILEPRRIYDRSEYLADQLGLGTAYRIAFGKPMPNTDRSLPERLGRMAADLVSYEADPALSATYTIMDRVSDWRESHGQTRRPGGGGETSVRTDALRNMRLALRYRDKLAFAKYIAQYMANGGNARGMAASIRNMDPLHAVKKEQRQDFINSLDEEDRKKLELAQQFYEDTFLSDRVREYKADAQPAIDAAIASKSK